jgi:hypothetical protein
MTLPLGTKIYSVPFDAKKYSGDDDIGTQQI